MKAFVIIAFLLGTTVFARAVDPVRLDAARFYYTEDSVRIEVYYSFPDTLLIAEPGETGYVAEAVFKLTAVSKGDTVLRDFWKFKKNYNKPPTKYEQDFFGTRIYLIPDEDMEFRLESIAGENESYLTVKESGAVNFSDDKLDLSEIELATEIVNASGKEGVYPKNLLRAGAYVVPNPSAFYFFDRPLLFAYAEIYNADKNYDSDLDVVYTIYNSVRNVVYTYEKGKSPKSDAVADFAQIPLIDFHGGIYYLEIKVRGPGGADSVYRLKKFYYVNPEKPTLPKSGFVESLSFEKSPFATMTIEQIEREIDYLRPLAHPAELEVYDMLKDLRGKQRFLYGFWTKRDFDTSTVLIEPRQKMLEYVEYANKWYSVGKIKGYTTDRGRILIKYGFPTDIEEEFGDGANKSYEIWMYDEIQGGAEFVFVDLFGNSNYELVHSSAAGEIANPYWYNEYVLPNRMRNDFER